MDEHRCCPSRHPSAENWALNLMPLKEDTELQLALVFQYAASGGCDFRDGVQSPVKEYIRESSK